MMKRAYPLKSLLSFLVVMTGTACTEDAADNSGGEQNSQQPPPAPKLCADGVELHEFDATVVASAFDAPAADFTANTVDGTFSLSEASTGCDHFVIVLHNSSAGGNAMFWNSSPADLFTDSADNTHYLFAVVGQDESTRASLIQDIQNSMNGSLAGQVPAVKDHWQSRLHYITDDARTMEPVAKALEVIAQENHVTIDRHQKLREGHNISVTGAIGWIPQIAQVRYWARYYNGQYLLDTRLAEQERLGQVKVVRVADGQDITGQGWADGHPMPDPFTWTLPDPALLSQYGKLEVDMHVDCPGAVHPFAQHCGEWDTVGSIYLCMDESCEQQRRFIKWITPYSSPGRWLIDVTPELVALAEAPSLTFKASHGDNNVGPYTYNYTVDFRFSEPVDGLKPVHVESLIPRGNYGWNDSFHEQWSEFSFTPPEDVKKVELYTRISGHGSAGGTQCAEFCTFTHQFTINQTPFAHTYEMEPDSSLCADRVEEGVTPNQGGTWFYDRSSWCPGFVIEEWREDITAATLVGEANTVQYASGLGTDLGTMGGGNMDMRVELVYYR